jgi:hypothetical protein
VRSTLPNGTTGDVRLQFGGNRLAPEASGERQYQLVNTAYWQHGRPLDDLTLTGAAVPRPDYVAYRSSLARVPGVPNGLAAPAYINLMGADFRAPVTWKASASCARRVTNVFTLTETFLAAETRHNYPVLRSESQGCAGVHPRQRGGARGVRRRRHDPGDRSHDGAFRVHW